MNIQEKLAAIQIEFHAKKSKYNSFGKYYFRSAEDILEALKPMIKKYNVTFKTSEKLIEYGTNGVIESTATVTDCEGGNFETAVALAGVEKAGGMALPQAFGSASSYAKKYSLGNLLLIDDTADPDVGKGDDREAITEEQLEKAKAFISKGGKIAAIEKKYKLTDVQRGSLS